MDQLSDELIILVEPSDNDKQAVLEYRDEFSENNEKPHGSADIEHAASYEAWLQSCVDGKHEETMPEGRVPATQFLVKRETDHRLVGMLQVRHTLNDFLKHQGGHIGYSVRKSERHKGYATIMLHSALAYCGELGIKVVLLTCDPDNLASSNVIKKNGGVLEKQITLENGEKLDHYLIRLF